MLLAFAAVCAGCATGRSVKGGYVVDAQAADEAQARRKAVASFFDAYVSSGAAAAAASLTEGTTAYVTGAKTLSAGVEGGVRLLKVRCVVDYAKLGRDLEAAGLVKPEGVIGQPKAALWIAESGPGVDPRKPIAAESLRLALAGRGYAAYALLGAKTEAEAAAKAREQGAALLIAGTARAAATQDGALNGFNGFGAALALKVYALPKGEIVDDVSSDATAVDLKAESAAAKALSNAGELAADKLKRFLPTRFVERSEMSVLILGLGGLPETLKLLDAVRRERGVVAAALSQLGGGDAKLRVWVERKSADELAADLLKLPGYSFTVRSVEPDFNSIELDTAGEAPL